MMPHALFDRDAVRRHLRLLFEQAVDEHDLLFCLFALPSRSVLPTKDFDEAVDWCAKRSGEHVYVSMGLYRTPPREGRGTAADVAGIAGFWVDVDILDEHAHKGKAYPPTEEAAREVCRVGGINPSFTVMSGFGLHAYWLLKEPLVFETDQHRSDAALLVARWQGSVQARARAAGYVVDSVHDLARVLRVAGTVNVKRPDDVRAVRLELPEKSGRFNVDELEPMMVAAEFVKPGAENYGGDINFVLNPDVVIQSSMMNMLKSSSPELKMLLEMNRPDFKDQSPSSYDMGICNHLVAAELDDQAIVDILVYWRRTVAKKPKLRVDYYQRTIGKIKASRQQRKAIVEIKNDAETVVSSNAQAVSQVDRDRIIEQLRSVLRIRISKFIQINRDDSTYLVVLDDGEEFSVGKVANITRFATFRDRILERCTVVLGKEVEEVWPKILPRLFSIVEKREAEEPRVEDRTKALVTRYLENTTVYSDEDWEQAIGECNPFVRDGMVWVNKSDYVRWCKVNAGLNLIITEVERDFHLLHMERQRHDSESRGKRRRPWYWGIPLDEVPTVSPIRRRKSARNEGGES